MTASATDLDYDPYNVNMNAEEILKRFPEWTVDAGAAKLNPTSTVRGWESLPVTIP